MMMIMMMMQVGVHPGRGLLRVPGEHRAEDEQTGPPPHNRCIQPLTINHYYTNYDPLLSTIIQYYPLSYELRSTTITTNRYLLTSISNSINSDLSHNSSNIRNIKLVQIALNSLSHCSSRHQD